MSGPRPVSAPASLAKTTAGEPSARRPSPRKALGLAMVVASFAVMTWAVFGLMQFGTCSSGGSFVLEQECAPGTGLKIVAIMASVLFAVAGAALTASLRVALAAWGIGFLMLAASFFADALGAGGPGQAPTTDAVVGFGIGAMFVVMALPALILVLKRPRT